MGCCLSSGKERRRHHDGGSPPPPSLPSLEEETVKEVLLETPINLPKAASANEESKGKPQINYQEWKVEVERAAAMNNVSNPPKVFTEEIVSEVSEVSEMCSVSEGLSNATATERNDDDGGEVNQRPPPPRKLRQGGVGVRRRVPVRRPAAPLPEKRGQVAPLNPVRGRPTAGHRRDVDAEKRGRRDAGESSCRRSRSPVTRGDASGRRNSNETKENGNGDSGGGKRAATTGEPPRDVESTEEAESLENPVVSLECFIFL